MTHAQFWIGDIDKLRPKDVDEEVTKIRYLFAFNNLLGSFNA